MSSYESVKFRSNSGKAQAPNIYGNDVFIPLRKGDRQLINRTYFSVFAIAMAAFLSLGRANVALASEDDGHGLMEFAAVLAAKTSLTQAVTAAEERTKGRAIKAEMERHESDFAYEVEVVSQDKVIEVRIDPSSGQVTNTEGQGFFEMLFDRGSKTKYRKTAGAPITLLTAIAKAEQEVGGKAIKAEIEDEDGQTQFEVKVASGKKFQKVTVDTTSGKVVKIRTLGREEDDND